MTEREISVHFSDGGDYPRPPRVFLRALTANALPPEECEVAVRFVSAAEMRKLNRRRGKNEATDVLAFGYHDEPIVGDIAVCAEVAHERAAQRGRNPMDYIMHLVVHAALHLAGWNHDTPQAAAKMENAEREVLARFGVPDPYAA